MVPLRKHAYFHEKDYAQTEEDRRPPIPEQRLQPRPLASPGFVNVLVARISFAHLQGVDLPARVCELTYLIVVIKL